VHPLWLVTGHSLCAAIAFLDPVYLQLHLPVGTHISIVCYGMPRVGNSALVNYVDAMHSADSVMVKVTHINKKDPIRLFPGGSWASRTRLERSTYRTT
jgi:predicted lipase